MSKYKEYLNEFRMWSYISSCHTSLIFLLSLNFFLSEFCVCRFEELLKGLCYMSDRGKSSQPDKCLCFVKYFATDSLQNIIDTWESSTQQNRCSLACLFSYYQISAIEHSSSARLDDKYKPREKCCIAVCLCQQLSIIKKSLIYDPWRAWHIG